MVIFWCLFYLRNHSVKKIILALGASAPVLLAGNVLAATQPNLPPGSQFRYVFVTSQDTSGVISATSNDIVQYNTLVNNAATNGSSTSTIPGPWAAMASTASISARTNTVTTGTCGVPIYRLDGALVANNYGDLWDGSITNPINIDQNDLGDRGVGVWTGTDPDGSAAPNPLGSSFVAIGLTFSTNAGWINSSASSLTFDSRPLYAMSSIQEIPGGPDPVIPEPTTIIASLLVGAGLLPLKRRRQKIR